MEISIFASGSKGNCAAVTGGGNILIDAGVSMRRISRSLADLNISAGELDGILITHEHSDHIAGLPMLLKHNPTPVYTTHTIANRLAGMYPEIECNLNVITPGEPFPLGEIMVKAFKTPHDSADSVGYRLENGSVLGFATDTGMITDEMLENLSGTDTAVIEANYDEMMLRNGGYPLFLKRRILSNFGHLSNIMSAELARTLAESGTKSIVLAHLSQENNLPETARRTVEANLAGENVELFVAPAAGFMRLPIKGAGECLV